MVRYVLLPNLYLAGRGEFLRRHTTVPATVNTDLKEFTICVGVPIAKNFELRPEFRGDFSNQPSFAGQDSQLTGTLAALATSSRSAPQARCATTIFQVAALPRSARERLGNTRTVRFERPRGRKVTRAFSFGGPYVSRSRSFSTPAAVTAGPAPGPVMTSGFFR